MAKIKPTDNIQVRFTANTAFGVLQDALNFSREEFEKLTEEDIEAAKGVRIIQWEGRESIRRAKASLLPTKSELQERKAELLARIEDHRDSIERLRERIDDINLQIENKEFSKDPA